jgi:CubicO group peptidase (beta-lactamase class C family)
MVLGRGFALGWFWPHPYGWWRTSECFGHAGNFSTLAWADPKSGCAIAGVTNGNRAPMKLVTRFAPTLPHRGTEELRFAPKFFDPKSPTYFTYSFAFVTEDTAPIPPAALATELTTYFRGLMSAVTGSPSDPSLHSATIVPDPQHDNAMLGTVHTIDGFGDKRALELHLEATTLACGNRQVVIASLSPRADDAIWTELRGVRASFTCAP